MKPPVLPALSPPSPEPPGWQEIECQINEILFQVCSGIPEEHVMHRIGVPLTVWANYKAYRLVPISTNSLFQLALCHRYSLVDSQRYRGVRLKSQQQDAHCAP